MGPKKKKFRGGGKARPGVTNREFLNGFRRMWPETESEPPPGRPNRKLVRGRQPNKQAALNSFSTSWIRQVKEEGLDESADEGDGELTEQERKARLLQKKKEGIAHIIRLAKSLTCSGCYQGFRAQ